MSVSSTCYLLLSLFYLSYFSLIIDIGVSSQFWSEEEEKKKKDLPKKNAFANFLCKIKVTFLWQDKRNLNKKSSGPFSFFSPPTVNCVSALRMDQTSPSGRNSYSAIKSTILPASASQLLKDTIPS